MKNNFDGFLDQTICSQGITALGSTTPRELTIVFRGGKKVCYCLNKAIDTIRAFDSVLLFNYLNIVLVTMRISACHLKC